MTPREFIAVYERILGLTGSMVKAARRGDWDQLVTLEKTCRAHVDRLIAMEGRTPELPPELQTRKAQLIRGVLADDAELRRITEPRMTQLEQLIGQSRNQRRLAHAYGAGT